jgi:ABC-type oligopeptide transport system ATPase subunit
VRLEDLQQALKLTYLFVAHDLAVGRHLVLLQKSFFT